MHFIDELKEKIKNKRRKTKVVKQKKRKQIIHDEIDTEFSIDITTLNIEMGAEAENEDKYDINLLIMNYNLHKKYVIEKHNIFSKYNILYRKPIIPEDISENIIKFIIRYNGDSSCSWKCKGDLISSTYGVIECKCITSPGPISFSPSSIWGKLYILDASKWLENHIILYRVDMTAESAEWRNIQINATQTFGDQAAQGRRPRIKWSKLYPQILPYCSVEFQGDISIVFNHFLSL